MHTRKAPQDSAVTMYWSPLGRRMPSLSITSDPPMSPSIAEGEFHHLQSSGTDTSLTLSEHVYTYRSVMVSIQ
jgi:hypothetical protein